MFIQCLSPNSVISVYRYIHCIFYLLLKSPFLYLTAASKWMIASDMTIDHVGCNRYRTKNLFKFRLTPLGEKWTWKQLKIKQKNVYLKQVRFRRNSLVLISHLNILKILNKCKYHTVAISVCSRFTSSIMLFSHR